ncbi:hypothetical protein D039_4514A, partial [Vibrio parahaemolyticus EKP-028]
MAGGF